jgi:hypothetical protein
MIERFKKLEPNLLLSRVGFVDCVSKKYGSTAVENENIKLVSGPEDLTAIGINIRTVGIFSEPTSWLEYQIEREKLMIVKESETLDRNNMQINLI